MTRATTKGAHNQAHIIAVTGGSGSGKSSKIKSILKEWNSKRIIFFDPKDEYGAFAEKVTTGAELWSKVMKKDGTARATFKVRLVPARSLGRAELVAMFEATCKLAGFVGLLDFVADELRKVTTAQRAPQAWSDVTGDGRHDGLRVIGISQRPAQLDKDFFSNCTEVYCGRLTFAEDNRAMANVMMVKKEEIASLPDLTLYHRDMKSGKQQRLEVEYIP